MQAQLGIQQLKKYITVVTQNQKCALSTLIYNSGCNSFLWRFYNLFYLVKKEPTRWQNKNNSLFQCQDIAIYFSLIHLCGLASGWQLRGRGKRNNFWKRENWLFFYVASFPFVQGLIEVWMVSNIYNIVYDVKIRNNAIFYI